MGLFAAVVAGVLFAANPHGNLVDETQYEKVLAAHLKDARVNYTALRKDRADLDGYLKQIAAVTKADFDKASKEAQVAYLTNAYNAYTLESIIDNYPIKGGLFGGANSIKGISGVWNKTKHKTAIGDVTLDFIEHETLRKKYDMPALHMALVCASKGCPPLRSEPYYADKLAEQLDDQARIYLASPYGLKVDGERVKVSAIFKWFAGDFEKTYGGWRIFVGKFAPPDQKEKVKAALKADTFEYIDYDWTLNDRKDQS